MLTDTKIKSAKPRDTRFSLTDGRGLSIEVMPSGAKFWRLKYTDPAGKRRNVSLGEFPIVKLSAARLKREEVKAAVKDGTDPFPTNGAAEPAPGVVTWKHAAQKYMEKCLAEKQSPSTIANRWRWLGRMSDLDNRPMAEIEPRDLLPILQRVEAEGTYETAGAMRTLMGQVMRIRVVPREMV
ncbi:Arm DNA-binding domain-containing protein [Psychromarinibacter sp. C21-152]|uniref:Arm DNA-binding domain-containing protein n=1 Tax=Psychromarinibacter sediminicola TaxID=3033385 RepID=A0AAE3NT91_9RHOB|nr:integrase arm-type DNA-binding domain-containing protein [Psychromarinibacter sediminicola]MDF0603933.1 Arm DNA-binding domain-containing protein [Psychromarinibacter sediminicola]